MSGYFLDPPAPGLIFFGRDPHTVARYRLWCLAFRADCTGFDTRWPRSAHPCPLTMNPEHRVSGYYSRSRTLYLIPPALVPCSARRLPAVTTVGVGLFSRAACTGFDIRRRGDGLSGGMEMLNRHQSWSWRCGDDVGEFCRGRRPTK